MSSDDFSLSDSASQSEINERSLVVPYDRAGKFPGESELFLLEMPSYVNFDDCDGDEPLEFSSDNYVVDDIIDYTPAHGGTDTTTGFGLIRHNGKETNARIIRWSDGSFTLQVGSEQLPLAMDLDDKSSAGGLFLVRNGRLYGRCVSTIDHHYIVQGDNSQLASRSADYLNAFRHRGDIPGDESHLIADEVIEPTMAPGKQTQQKRREQRQTARTMDSPIAASSSSDDDEEEPVDYAADSDDWF